MGSIPQGVFAARKVRHQVEHCLANPTPTANDSSKGVFNNKALEQRPLKYNSKLMNSIWGLYNRYSVHNFKKNTDDAVALNFAAQQCQVGSAAQPVPAEPTAVNGALGATNPPPIGGVLNFYRSVAFVVKTI